MSGLEFKNPWALLLLVPYALMVFVFLRKRIFTGGVLMAASSKELMKPRRTFRTATYRYLPVLRLLAIFLLIIAVSRPGRGIDYSSVKNLGIDIMIALDVSGSMMGEDFQPDNRLAVARAVVSDFISKRPGDRIGMTVFAGEAYLQCPLTSEHNILGDIISSVDFGTVAVDGTAIGDALSLSAARLAESKAKSRIILLITDGVNNRGRVDPETASGICAELGIKVYSVGIGREGKVPYPGGGIFGKRYIMNQFDPESLQKISEKTGGRFYRAQSADVFRENMRDIDALEKSEIDLKIYHEFHDKFQFFLIAAAVLFAAEILLSSLYFRKVP